MTRQQSRDRNKPREFSGLKYAESALDLLNFIPQKKDARFIANSKARVIAVIDAIRSLLGAMERDPGWFRNREEPGSDRVAHCSPEVRDGLTKVNLLLCKYHSFSLILPDPKAKRLWSIESGIAGKIERLDEAWAVESVVQLADAGLLDRLQVCDCGKWYFARFSHQRHCSKECRVTFWESSEERKEQKRKLARSYYLHYKIQNTGGKRGTHKAR